MRRRLSVALALLVALVAVGCAPQQTAPASRVPQPNQKLTVFAAASLKGAFTDIAALDPGLSVQFSFEGSSTLVDQLAGGARADVLATADEATMNRAHTAGLLDGEPTNFASNHLVLVVPTGNPGGITGLDASLEGRKLVVCAPAVPCGAASVQLAQRLGVALKPVSQEQKVTDVLGKVGSGEADAGLVYVTDARSAAGRVDVVEVPGSEAVVNRYPIAALKDAPDAAGARRFVELVASERGREVLQRYGFVVG